jgi:diacylglycerol kinase (ATP)
MAGRRALLLINRLSRGGETDLADGLESLRQQNISLRQEFLDQPGSIPRLIQSRCQEVDLVIVAGGDGTINAAIEPLLACALPLGILPIGTANDLARTLGIPPEPRRACEIIAAGRLVRIDLGWVNGKHFFNVASLGVSVEVAGRLSPDLKRRWGPLSYLYGAATVLRRNKHAFSVRIICDGRPVRTRAMQISVANGRYYGGGVTVAEDAAIDDARLDLYALRPLGFWQMLSLAPAFYQGRHGRSRDKVRFLHGREIEIRTRAPMPIDTDGELTAATPARFRVVPQALAVYVPPDYRTSREKRHAAEQQAG